MPRIDTNCQVARLRSSELVARWIEDQIRKAEFAVFTPYPGTPSWRKLLVAGRILHRDWSLYNDANVVFRPARMTPEQLHRGYLRLWREFYADRSRLQGMSATERTIQF